MADVKALAEELVNLSVKDVQELAQILKDEYGIEPAAAAVVVAADGAGAGAAEAEQTEFDVILKGFDPAKKIGAIKAVRACVPELGLKEAKDLVEQGGKVKEGVSKADAADMKAKLEAEGCTVEVK